MIRPYIYVVILWVALVETFSSIKGNITCSFSHQAAIESKSCIEGSVQNYACLVAAVEGKYCATGDTSEGCEQCPPDKPWTDCDLDPCIREQEFGCPLHKHENPTCVSNQCGGCYDNWFLPSGRQVWCWGP